MANVLTEEQQQAFITTVEEVGYKWDLDLRLYPFYSGRGMYGDYCFGFVVEEPTLVHFVLGCMVKENMDLSVELMNVQKVDALGTDFIVYFPGYLWTERTEQNVAGNDLRAASAGSE